jgi:hypothetical protein
MPVQELQGRQPSTFAGTNALVAFEPPWGVKLSSSCRNLPIGPRPVEIGAGRAGWRATPIRAPGLEIVENQGFKRLLWSNSLVVPHTAVPNAIRQNKELQPG